MLLIRKPIGKPVDGGNAIFEEEYFFNPRRRALSGSAYEDYEEVVKESGDREVFRVPYTPWFEGITGGSKWEVHVYDSVNEDFVKQDLLQVQRVGSGALELFVSIKATDIPKVVVLPPALFVGGSPLLVGGHEIRL